MGIYQAINRAVRDAQAQRRRIGVYRDLNDSDDRHAYRVSRDEWAHPSAWEQLGVATPDGVYASTF